MSKQQTNTARPLYVSVIAALLIAGGWVAYQKLYVEPGHTPRAGGHGGGSTTEAADAGSEAEPFPTDDDRIKYVAQSVEVTDLQVGHDPKPDDAGFVPGLLIVSGTAHNKGDKPLRTLRIVIHPQTNTGKVLGTYIEDVLRNERLTPGGTKSFKFRIPERPEFSGKFLHEVR